MDGPTAIAFAHSCREAAPLFLEEPVWPPEDFATLAEVRIKGGLNVAAGENACTAHQFSQMMKAGAVSHAQPSVTKVGGITEYLKVVTLADEMGVRLAPHSPYFGPGLLATLQLLSLRDDATFVEVFYMKCRVGPHRHRTASLIEWTHQDSLVARRAKKCLLDEFYNCFRVVPRRSFGA